MTEITVIIPAYNEELRLLPTLKSVYAYLLDNFQSFEILVVNDGSTDKTRQVFEDFASTHKYCNLLSFASNSGKGHAVRQGILQACGELMLLNDADGSSPIEELSKLQAHIYLGADIVIGSRAKPDLSRKIQTPIYRKIIGRVYSLIVNSALLPGFYDTQCGFKLYKRDVAKLIFALSNIDGYSYDIETLFLAHVIGFKIEEVAINWHNVEGSKVNILTDSVVMFWETIKIFTRYHQGKYQLNTVIQHNNKNS